MLSRVGGFVAMLPVPGSFGVPPAVRVAVAIVLSFVLTVSFVSPLETLDGSGFRFAWMGREAALGLFVGFCFRLVFSAFQLAGQLISIQMGLGFAVLVDPKSSSQLSLISHYLYLLAALMFLSIDGHVLVVELLVESFRVIPLGKAGFVSASKLIVEWGGVVFWGALWIGLPVLLALLLANVAFGVITRATPQLNIFAIGFPVTLMLGLVGLMYLTPTMGVQLETLFARAVETAQRVLEAQVQ